MYALLISYRSREFSKQRTTKLLQIEVRRHIDRTMRTRNFRARNEFVERRVVTKRQNGRKASMERKVSCSFSHDRASGNRCDLGQERQSSSPAPKAQSRTDGQKPSKSSGRTGENLSGSEAEFRADISFWESVRIHHAIMGTLPCALTTSLNPDAHMATHVDSDTLRLMCSPAKSRRKVA